MNQNIICYVLGRLVLAEAVILGIPFFMALYGWEKSAPAFAVSICICVLIGSRCACTAAPATSS